MIYSIYNSKETKEVVGHCRVESFGKTSVFLPWIMERKLTKLGIRQFLLVVYSNI